VFLKVFSFGGPLLLAGALTLAGAGQAAARGGGGGHGGGGHFGGAHFGGAHYGGGWHGGGWGGYRHYGGYGYGGYGYGGYPYGYGGYGYGYYPYGYGSGYDPYSYGSGYYPSYNYDTFDPGLASGATYESGYNGYAGQPTPSYNYGSLSTAELPQGSPPWMRTDTAARLTVKVPADAEVWVEGKKTTSTGPVRQYQSPPLKPGQPYTYEVRARWQENGREVTQTQHVEVSSGASAAMDFPTPSAAAAQPATAQAR
jgi:uncharacterized protein (TIGR03000 family)